MNGQGGCRTHGNVTICTPRTFNYRGYRHCPTCHAKRLFLISPTVWYPTILTCLTCGDSWSDGERMTRPFARGWRVDAVRRAKAAPFDLQAVARAAYKELELYR